MVESFHGSKSAGLILGEIMVDYALSEMPETFLGEIEKSGASRKWLKGFQSALKSAKAGVKAATHGE